MGVMAIRLAAGIVLPAVAAALWVLCVPRERRIQFSLRTLMIGVTVVAIVLSSISTWRYLSLARIEWLAPSSTAARQLWTELVVAKRGEDFTAVFTPKFRDVSDLYAIKVQTKPAWQGSFGRKVDHPRQTIWLESSHQPRLEETLSAPGRIRCAKEGMVCNSRRGGRSRGASRGRGKRRPGSFGWFAQACLLLPHAAGRYLHNAYSSHARTGVFLSRSLRRKPGDEDGPVHAFRRQPGTGGENSREVTMAGSVGENNYNPETTASAGLSATFSSKRSFTLPDFWERAA